MWWKFLVQACFAVLPLIALLVFLKKPGRKPFYRSVVILVLGDIGRSPRMMYHSESFAQQEFETFVVGYKGTEPSSLLRSLPHVRFLYLTPPPAFISRLPRAAFLVFAPLKVAFQILVVLHALLFRLPFVPEYILVQNPPTIPTLALVQLVCRIRGSKLIIDWHNLGYSILALRLGEKSPVVRLAKWFERTFGQKAYAHLFVTNAMKKYLLKEWDLKGRTAVLHDRPPAHFHPSSPSEIHELFSNFPVLTPGLGSFLPNFQNRASTPFTKMTSASEAMALSMASAASFTPEAMPTLRPDRPALVITSTSWTADEDFSLLVKALSLYERRAREVNARSKSGQKRLPKLLMVVTGRGDLRDQYMEEVTTLEQADDWKWVRCRSVWMSSSDYPILLGSADLGVSLHSSSSALDLPMKVVDMFGCGLPVCALDFACLDELVKDGINGVVFRTAAELAAHFERLLMGFPLNDTALQKLRGSLRQSLKPGTYPDRANQWIWGTWSENWNRIVKPLVVADVHYYKKS